MLDAVTDVTLPLAKLNPVRAPPEAAPDGGVGTLPLLGRVPPLAPVPPGKPPALPAPPKRPVVQLPDALGLLTVTWLAIRVPVEVDPVTVTQSPAATSAAVSFTVLVKVVDEVQLTVT
jgi:hypothetical protein